MDALIDPLAYDQAPIIMGPERLREMNPQRFEMEQLTGVLAFEPEQELIVGLREVRADEWWVRGHVPGRPILPGVLMLEAAAQLGNALLNLGFPDRKGLWGFGGIDAVKFRGMVVPGDKLIIAVKALDVRKRVSKFVFQGFVREKRVVEGAVVGMLLFDA
jgi:3-hydroxyacyl-[acyl-carrier-protein] dehydratase